LTKKRSEAMRSYKQKSRSGGGRYGGRDFRRRDSGRREMHKAVCDECGNNCEVPFKPSGDKPIYCSDCFESKDGGSRQRASQRSSRGSDFRKRDNTNIQLLEQVSFLNEKLDKIVRILESIVVDKQDTKEPKSKKVVKKATSKDN
jgi:CxxC-x17-CxxC domain-containing protein